MSYHNVFLNNGMLLHFSIDQQLVFVKKKLDRNKNNWREPTTPKVFYSEKEMKKKEEERKKEIEKLKETFVDNRPFSLKDDVTIVGKKMSYEKMINKSKHKDDYKKQIDNRSVVPAEIHVGLLRDQITMNNINQYYSGTIIQFKGTSQEFIKSHLVAFISRRITKSKGMLDPEDVLIKEWLIFQDVPQNQTIFKLDPTQQQVF